MDEHEFLASRFEEHRPHLTSVAYRLLGSRTEADNAVQETWLRLARSGTDGVTNLGGWLTTVVARVALNMLRSRTTRHEQPLDVQVAEPAEQQGPEEEAVLADSVGLALLVVLDTLSPAERLAFVLHDMFGVPFDELGEILDRSPTAARQLASRARRRVQGAGPPAADDLTRRRTVVDAFLAASREGDFATLLSLLDPEVVLRADDAAVAASQAARTRGGPDLDSRVTGASAVANAFAGRAQAAQPALVDGAPAATWAPGGRPRGVFTFAITDGLITGIEIIADGDHIAELDVQLVER
ncbi:MAG: sigma-70 family RNA polymerase sigma factor [Streptosporangiales bacterium]|nr:sigma-70 family RNA polymerase sigma factor [Streptosporangiales bacterium]